MLAPTIEEIKGTFNEYPFAELLIEAAQSRLSGSFRLAHEDEKAVFYLKNGEIVFAVSNLRQHRMFELVLQSEKVAKADLVAIPNFTNDFELTQNLISKEILTKDEIAVLFARQIEGILLNSLNWETGAWSFSHLARAKDELQFKVNLREILLTYARNLQEDYILSRFRSFEERFFPIQTDQINFNLLPQEYFLLSRIEGAMRVQDIRSLGGLTEPEMLKSLYILWFGGFLGRKNWNSKFSENKIKELLSAKLILKKEALQPDVQKIERKRIEKAETVEESPIEEKANHTKEEQKQLQEYLKRVEDAESYYEILDVSVKAKTAEIKAAYFGLAKQYHPDKYHQDTDKVLQQQVQNAFTEIARAYDTLKDEKSRELYDFKLRKYLESVKDQQSYTSADSPVDESDTARTEFDQGFEYLMNQNYEEALPYLTRAAQLSPNNPRYRAYFGKVLSVSESQRHKAESEMQAAIKLDTENPTYRIMLVEFFIQYKLYKRAEGELQRILTSFPGNKEAEVLLDNLRGN